MARFIEDSFQYKSLLSSILFYSEFKVHNFNIKTTVWNEIMPWWTQWWKNKLSVLIISGASKQPTENINLKGRTFEDQCISLVRDVFEPAGFSLVRFTRVPYLCEGDLESSFYVLDDAVFVLKLNEKSEKWNMIVCVRFSEKTNA